MKKLTSVIKAAATLLLSATVLFTGCTALTDGVAGGNAANADGSRSAALNSSAKSKYRNVAYVLDKTEFRNLLDTGDYKCYTHIGFHLAEIDKNGNLNKSALKEAIKKDDFKKLHDANVKILLSFLGGGTQSEKQYKIYHSVMGSSTKRSTFINDTVSFVKNPLGLGSSDLSKYTGYFDGVDLDWEYMSISSSDYPSYNKQYIDLVYLLSDKLSGTGKIITMAGMTSEKFYKDTAKYEITARSDKKGIKDMFSKLEFVSIMTYDYNTSSKKISATGSFPRTAQTIEGYIAAGLSASKINIGIPFNGYAFDYTSDGWTIDATEAARIGSSYKPDYKTIMSNKKNGEVVHHKSETYNGTTLTTIAYCTGYDEKNRARSRRYSRKSYRKKKNQLGNRKRMQRCNVMEIQHRLRQ